MPLLLTLVVVLTFLYLSTLFWLSLGLRRLESSNKAAQFQPHHLPTVTLIICARNEAQRLPRLLQALAQQQYPSDKLEICLVDDRSTDRTSEIFEKFALTHANAIHLRINNTLPNFAPKKRAIDTAIQQTPNEIILLTDADAEPGPWWVREIAALFKPGVVMVCGYSPYLPRETFWQKILALEYFSHAAVAAGGSGLGRPLTCTGSNMAYRREAYFRIGGFSGIAHWISGDDDLLLHKMQEARLGKIVYATHANTHAPVRPPASWKEFQSQRTRYASKSRHYEPALTLSLGLVYLLNLILGAAPFSIFWGKWFFLIGAISLALLKASGEYLNLRQAARLFGEEKILAVFPVAALLHPFYVVYFATRGQFAKFHWRGDEFTARRNPARAESASI